MRTLAWIDLIGERGLHEVARDLFEWALAQEESAELHFWCNWSPSGEENDRSSVRARFLDATLLRRGGDEDDEVVLTNLPADSVEAREHPDAHLWRTRATGDVLSAVSDRYFVHAWVRLEGVPTIAAGHPFDVTSEDLRSCSAPHVRYWKVADLEHLQALLPRSALAGTSPQPGQPLHEAQQLCELGRFGTLVFRDWVHLLDPGEGERLRTVQSHMSAAFERLGFELKNQVARGNAPVALDGEPNMPKGAMSLRCEEALAKGAMDGLLVPLGFGSVSGPVWAWTYRRHVCAKVWYEVAVFSGADYWYEVRATLSIRTSVVHLPEVYLPYAKGGNVWATSLEQFRQIGTNIQWLVAQSLPLLQGEVEPAIVRWVASLRESSE